jgi:GNAT superfamily N-acetyltransferase
VAEEDGGIVAFSMADRRRGEVWALFTLPGHEGRGYGSGLLENAEQWLRKQGFDRIFAETGAATVARGFYARRGWIEIEGPAADAADVRMAKRV